MKVILLIDVANLGHKFDVVEVPDGYALNKLIPKKMALLATSANIKKLTAKRDHDQGKKESSKADFHSNIHKLDSRVLEVIVKANDQGHLFEALKAPQLIESAKMAGIDLPDSLSIKGSIKNLGEQEVTVEFLGESKDIKINLIAK